ncbi:MAG: Ldh family oxidoreductase [Tissierellia bacterium]|nr:Ldh family oxidoreductase [Tissierellia bacterium]
MEVLINDKNEEKLIVDILQKVGVDKSDAQKVADVLVAADLRGIKSHGIARLPIYVERLQAGLINKNPDIKAVKENKGVALIDGDNGLGQVASSIAMEKCIELAKEYGISVVGLKNSNHFGIAAYYSMMAAENDLIGFVATNTSPLMAPFGGREAMLGTNPFTVAVPANDEADIVLDMATSLVPRGKVEVFEREGKEAPIGWGINKEGLNTTDPKEILEGTLLPVGGPKGYGMAIIVDILSGLMTGSTYLNDVGSLFGDRDKNQNLGMIMVAIDISNFMEIDEFKNDIDEYINRVRSSEKASGNNRIFLPGEIEYNNTLKNIENGITYEENLYGEISDLANSFELNINDYIIDRLP